ncbi:Hypothetical protein SMAX5B_010557 [Scophthalmus maximus]|uniref:Uncharacterized protein n=1 Tax=Scophthalmus maximus TaxID=52904 RepID=A0A2U9B0J1_SCOMX|nr:Hypothetical protein SMAX5B_010557 [Scophthalmus maximus]
MTSSDWRTLSLGEPRGLRVLGIYCRSQPSVKSVCMAAILSVLSALQHKLMVSLGITVKPYREVEVLRGQAGLPPKESNCDITVGEKSEPVVQSFRLSGLARVDAASSVVAMGVCVVAEHCGGLDGDLQAGSGWSVVM